MLKKILSSFLVIVLLFSSIDSIAFIEVMNETKAKSNKDIVIPKKIEKVRELREKREPNTKTFLNSDGTYTTDIYTEDVHYEVNGELENISNTPEENTKVDKQEFKFENKDNRFKVKFATNSSKKNLLNLKLDKENINFKLLHANHVNAKKIDGLIVYENILDNVDLQYSIGNANVKEDIYLKTKNSARTITFQISGDLIPKMEGRNINFYNKKQELIWIMPHPFMEDKNGKYSEDIDFTIETNKKDYILTLKPSVDFLEAEDTEYPVRIDPTVNLGGSDTNTKDTYVMQKYPTLNYYLTPELRSGYTQSTGVTRTYLDFSQALPNLKGKLLVKSEIKLYKWKDSGTVISTNAYANRVTKAWDSKTVTYGNQPTFNTSVSYGSTNATGAGKWLSLNVSDLVNGWMKGSFPNYGVVVRSTSEGTLGSYRKYSASETASNKPHLSVTYAEKPSAPTATAYSNSNGTGYVNVSWPKVDGATGYKVLVFNGRAYEEFDVGNVTSWSTKGKKIWPTRAQIDSKQYGLRKKGDGRELPENPNDLYKRGGGNYQTRTNYWFRVKAYNKYDTTTESNAAMPSIPDKTKPTVPSAVQVTNDRMDMFTYTWQPSSDLDGSGVAKYKVFLGDQPNTANIVNGAETTGRSFTYKGNLQPRKTYYAWVQSVDKSGNISNNSVPVGKAARKDFDAQIVSYFIPENSDIDNANGENLWFDVKNMGTSSWTNDLNISLSVTSKTPDGSPPVGFVGYLNTGEIIKPNEVKRFYVNWKPKKGVIGSYGIKAVVGKGPTPTYINPPENIVNRTIALKDITSPTGKIVINGDAKYTTDSQVSLNVFDVFDNAVGKKYAQFANGAKDAIENQLTFSNSNHVPQSQADFPWQLEDREGVHYVYTRFLDESGNISTMYFDSIIYDRTLPKIKISNVSDGEFITGIKRIEGSVTDDHEKVTYTIEYNNKDNDPVDWKLIHTNTNSVVDGLLAEWDTSSLPKGEYNLRISATDEAGQTNLETRTVWIDHLEQEWLGQESYFPMHSLDLVDGSGFVNLYNGSLTIQDDDFSLPSRGFSLDFKRFYSSNRMEKGILGKGWISSLEEKLDIQSTYIDYYDHDGSIHRFSKLDNGEFSTPTGTALFLRFSEMDGYELTSRDGSTTSTFFNKSGKPTKIIDSNGNILEYEYDQTLLKKVSSLNKHFTLQYTPEGTLSDVVYSTGEKISFKYNNSFLTDAILYTKSGTVNRQVHYDYKEDKLQAIVSQNGLKVDFSYNGSRLEKMNSSRSTRVINGTNQFPLQTFNNIKETFSYDLRKNTIYVTSNSVNKDNSSKNLFNKEYKLNGKGNLHSEKVIRTYLENEDPQAAKDDVNNITTFTEYENNLVKSSTDPLGNKTVYVNDQYGNVVEKLLPPVTTNGVKKAYSIKNKYNERGQITQTTNTLGQVKEWKYDAKGNNTEIIDEEGNHQYFTYDAYGNITTTSSDRGPLYGYIPDFSMEEKGLNDWTIQGNVKKINTEVKSGKQSIEMEANSRLESSKLPIKKGRLPVAAFIETIAPGVAATGELKLQFLKNETILEEFGAPIKSATAWKKARVSGAVPSEATHVRVSIVNNGSTTMYIDDLVFEETNIATKNIYDSNGENVSETIDAYGDSTRFTYNEYGQVLSETNSLNETTTNVYDEKQQIKQSKDGAGRLTEFHYDQMGNVTKEINSLGQATLFEYNEWGQLLATKEPSVTMTYYKNETVDRTEQKQAQLFIEYDELGRKIKETDENGHIIMEEYNGFGQISRVIDPMQNQKYFAYDKNGNEIHTIDYAAKETPDSKDKVLIAKGEMFADYDEWNRQISETDNTGNRNTLTMTNTYDSENRLIHTKDAEGTELHYTFNAAGEIIYTKDNSQPVVETWTYYDGLGTPAITLSGNIAEFSVTDANENVLQTIDHSGTKVSFEYNAVGDKVKQTNTDGSTVEWTYNKEGQILTEKQKVEETDKTITNLITHYVYNAAAEVTKQTLEGETFDKQSNVTSTKKIKETDLTYDELGRIVREYTKFYEENTNSFKKSDVRFLYDLNGNLIHKWIYDESSETINPSGGAVYPFVRSESKFEYDANNRFTREEKVENSVVTVQTYKDDENAEEIHSALGTSKIYYNENDLASKIITPKSEEYHFTYTASELKDKIKGPRLTIDMDYGVNEKMSSIKMLKNNSTNALFSETYTYNGEEQITSATNEVDGKKSFTYTTDGFLRTVTKGQETLTYSYDNSGNLLKVVDQSGKLRLENQYGQGNRITSSIQYEPTTKKYKKVTYSFSTDGSLKQEVIHQSAVTVDEAKRAIVDIEKTYVYASINMLKSITTTQGKKTIEKIEYTYDSEDNRTSKKVTDSQGERFEFYYYDANGDLVSISRKTGIDLVENLINIYRDSSGQLLSFEYKGSQYDYVYNQRGDIVAITDERQEILARYTYDEWGNQIKIDAPTALGKEIAEANPFRYVGKFGVQYDQDTKLSFMGWRDYDPTIGRFLVADEYEGEDDNPISFNRYLYAESDPVNNIDPDGYSPKWLKMLSKGVKKDAKSVYNLVIGDDIATIRSKNTKWHQKALAGVSIASNFFPGGGFASKAVKLGIKGTSKAIKTHKSSKKIASGSKKVKRSGKKIKVTKKAKTRYASSIKRSPKTNNFAQKRVQKSTAKPKKKMSSAKKRPRGNTTTRIEKKQSRSSASKGTLKTADDLIKNATPGRATKGRTAQYDLSGGFDKALKDFGSLQPKITKNTPELKVGTLKDGRTVIVRKKSSDGRPTIEIQEGKKKIKFRY